MMSLSLDEPRPIDSRGRASPPGEASSGELSGELYAKHTLKTKQFFSGREKNTLNNKKLFY